MTAVATVIAWISFGGVGDSLKRIVTDNIPTVVLAASLAEQSGIITATAPALAAAESEADRARAWTILSQNLKSMDSMLSGVDAVVLSDEAKTLIRTIIDELQANLRALDTNVRKRFWFQNRNAELVDRLRWAHANFLDEVEPMIEDARFRIELAVDSAETSDGERAFDSKLTYRDQTAGGSASSKCRRKFKRGLDSASCELT